MRSACAANLCVKMQDVVRVLLTFAISCGVSSSMCCAFSCVSCLQQKMSPPARGSAEASSSSLSDGGELIHESRSSLAGRISRLITVSKILNIPTPLFREFEFFHRG